MSNNLPSTMKAMVLERGAKYLVSKTIPLPHPLSKQVLIKILACGVCRTDIHIVDGELAQPKFPLIPGHEIIGTVVQLGEGATILKVGDLVGIAWLGYTCDECKYCAKGRENLCVNALFTGYTIDGGFAEYTVANEAFCFPLDPVLNTPAAAPLLCAGLIGYRCYHQVIPQHDKIGIFGFGAAAHILTQIAVRYGKKIYAFTLDGDTRAQEIALSLGAVWAGGSSSKPPEILDDAIIFAPVGSLIAIALKNIDKGGTVTCGGIHMSDIPSFPYKLLWEERLIRSVANLTRKDGIEFLELASHEKIITEIHTFSLEKANEALDAVRNNVINGTAVLVI